MIFVRKDMYILAGHAADLHTPFDKNGTHNKYLETKWLAN
jgi:hypothetical protein